MMPTAQTPDHLTHLDAPDTDPALADAIRRVLRHGHTIDITTIGRRSGQPRRIEIVFHSFDGRLYISGTPSPRTRAWLHNLRANPALTFHLKQPIKADLPATAREITDPAERLAVLTKVAQVWRREVEPMERFSPLIEVTIDGLERIEPAAEGAVDLVDDQG
jgi:deazaflavin-dependent oxidoreductase (nitroreductase family)